MYGPQAALIAEAFTPRLRYSGSSLGYQLASIIAGGLPNPRPGAASRETPGEIDAEGLVRPTRLLTFQPVIPAEGRAPLRAIAAR
jgi:hypothetical protein